MQVFVIWLIVTISVQQIAGRSEPIVTKAPALSKCQREREAALDKQDEEGGDVFVAACDEQGDYEPEQCSDLSGECWCVTKPGLEIPNTRSDEPDCEKILKTRQVVVMLLDVSGSLINQLDKVTDFLQTFLQFTSTKSFFANHKTELTAVPFDVDIIKKESWKLDYKTFKTAAELRNSEKTGLKAFVDKIKAKKPVSKTNIGKSLRRALYNYRQVLKSNGMVIIVSDFINMLTTPSIASVLRKYNKKGIHLFPVLLDKKTRFEKTFNDVMFATLDRDGIDIRNGTTAADVQSFYNI